MRAILAGCLLLLAAEAAAQQISLSIADLVAPTFGAKRIRAEWRDSQRLTLKIGELFVAGHSWREVRLDCERFQLSSAELRCENGLLDAGERLPLRLRYNFARQEADVTLSPGAGENWRLNARLGDNWQVEIGVENGKLAHFARWLPESWPKLGAGTLNGSLQASGAREDGKAAGNLRIIGLAFSDASGLHAAEKLGGQLEFAAENRQRRWHWQAALDWDAGELFWQPFYMTGGGSRIAAQGSYADGEVAVEQGKLSLAALGEAEFSGAWEKAAGLRALQLRSGRLDLAELYRKLLQPLLAKTAGDDMRAGGSAELEWRIEQGATAAFSIVLRGATLQDNKQRFALSGLNADIPWRRDAATQAELSFDGGEVWRLPLGAARIAATVAGYQIAAKTVQIPLLGGLLKLEDFSARKAEDGWQWQVGAELTPVSMQRFSQALGWTTMHGSLSAVVPRLEYAQSRLQVQGALLFKVFDGDVVAYNLALLDPFGRAPRLYADVHMSNLDLDLLTRTFSFGNITGRIDARVDHLELSNWQPVRFDAGLASSAGEYPRTISQTAVQNISALGGAGAAAAIQRSFLRFFERFGYRRIGLSCALKNGVCRMDGIEALPQGYRIVQGGGVPAITVMGYNRDVSWDELLTRLKRITQSNVKPIVE